ncbi:MAG: 6-phosphogluconolactonase [Candidatus Bipolaricaulia bacterium]
MANPVSPEVRVFPDLEGLSREAAREVRRVINEAAAQFGRCAVALAGGSTPRRLYEILAHDESEEIPWENVHAFWGDERCVPPDHDASNVRLARETLIDHVDLPPGNIHAVPVQAGSPDAIASAYEAELRAFFTESTAIQSGWPRFDLVLLGIGGDGHTASLFPDSPALDAGDRWVTPSQAPEDADVRDRVTLTLPVINHARAAFVMTAGASKQPVVREILETPEAAVMRYPAARVHPRGRLVWWVDRAAIGLDGGTS